jgi:hypothetical protein
VLIVGGNQSAGGYDIDNSCRFNDSSNDNLARTPASASNQKTWTWSGWVKRSTLGGYQVIFGVNNGNSDSVSLELGFFTDNLVITLWNFYFFITNAVYRDTSAWYHIVFAFDTTQATSTNRFKVYVNGEQVTSFSQSTYPTQNTDWVVNSTASHRIGIVDYISAGGLNRPFDGYISEVNFVDGQQLDPTSFGEFDSSSGIWKPIAYEGTYGTNGFYLEFKDSSALGDDTSGNTNDFTVNNLTSIDQTTDTPTNNFTLLNTLNYSSSARTYAEGNTAITSSDSGSWNAALNNIGVRSGKWYTEYKITSVGSFSAIGVTLWPVLSPVNPSATLNFTFLVGEDSGSFGWRNNGVRPQGGSNLSSWTTNDILMIAMDMDNLKVYFGKNGTWENSGVPTSGATGTGSIGNLTANEDYFFVISPRGGSTYCNYGNPAFTISSGNSDADGYGNFEYSVPSGYYALCTKNLAEYG